jgi:hypothetical protein
MTNLLRCNRILVLRMLLLLSFSSQSLVSAQGLLSSSVPYAQHSQLLRQQPRQLQSNNSTVTPYTGQPQCDGKNGSLVSLAKAPYTTSLNNYSLDTYQPTCSCEQVPYNGQTVLGPLVSLAPTNTSTIAEQSLFWAKYNAVFDQLENYIAYSCLNTCETCYQDAFCGIYNVSYSYLDQGGESNYSIAYFPANLTDANLITASINSMNSLTVRVNVCFQYTKGSEGTLCFTSAESDHDIRVKKSHRVANATLTYNDQVCNSFALVDKGLNNTFTDYCLFIDCSNLAIAESNETLVWNTCNNNDRSQFQGRFAALVPFGVVTASNDFGTLGRCDFPLAAPANPPALSSPTTVPEFRSSQKQSGAPVAIITGITVPLVALILLTLGYFILRTKKEKVVNPLDGGTSQGDEGGGAPSSTHQASSPTGTGSGKTTHRVPETPALNTSGPTVLPYFKDQTRSRSGYTGSDPTEIPIVSAIAVQVFPDAADDPPPPAQAPARQPLLLEL